MRRARKIKPIVDPARYVRGEQPYPYAQCKREIRKHIDEVLVYAASLEPWPPGIHWRGGAMTVPPHQRRQQAVEDVMAMALETISCQNLDADGHQVDINDRRQDLLLARYALRQSMRLGRPHRRLGVG